MFGEYLVHYDNDLMFINFFLASMALHMRIRYILFLFVPGFVRRVWTGYVKFSFHLRSMYIPFFQLAIIFRHLNLST